MTGPVVDSKASDFEDQRHIFPVRLGCVGCSFQFGRTDSAKVNAKRSARR
jgi:hypothetical protein